MGRNCGTCKHWGGSPTAPRGSMHHCPRIGIRTCLGDVCEMDQTIGGHPIGEFNSFYQPKNEPFKSRHGVLRSGRTTPCYTAGVGQAVAKAAEFRRLVDAVRDIDERLSEMEAVGDD